MIENLTEAVEYLIQNKYVELHNKKYKFSSLFYKELTGIEKGLTSKGVVLEPLLPTVQSSQLDTNLVKTYTLADWRRYYIEFIKVSGVPEIIRSGLSTYPGNKFSEEGMKAFKTAMVEGYKLEWLISAVKLYYKDNTGYKKALTNYMKDGDWRTDYETIQIAVESGTVLALVQDKTKENNESGYRIG